MVQTTIVSAFYKIPSKKPYDEYRVYLSRWFRSIRCKVVFFTTEDVWEDIKCMGCDLSNIHVVFHKLEDWAAWKKGDDFWKRQYERDPEKYHTPELGAVWYQKKEFIKRAFDITESDVWIWCDAGCVRDDVCEHALLDFGKRQYPVDDGRLHIQYINCIEPKQFYQYPDVRFAGAIMAGTRDAWLRYDMVYDDVLNEYDTHGYCCNSDQYILSKCYDKDPSIFYAHPCTNLNGIDRWFFFLGIL